MNYLFGGKPPKAREPYCRPTNRPTYQQTTNDRLTPEELNYSGDRARRHQRPTKNILEVWQHLAPFGGRPIGGAVEALFDQSRKSAIVSIANCCLFLLPPATPLLACYRNNTIKQC
jgi:hypothetical protein